MADETKEITFRASFPPIQSAIKRDGSAGGMRIQLDIPESEMATAAYLIAMVQQRLIITVKVDDGKSDTAIKRRAAKKRK